MNEQLLQLPPSLKAGDSIQDRAGQTYMQPQINYVVRASVEVPSSTSGSLVKVQSTREIRLIPFTEIRPPLATEDFPGEYTSSSTKSLTRVPFGGLFGELSISMNEPSPLKFTDGPISANTLGSLRLALRPVDVVATIEPRSLTCIIHSTVLVKVISSATPLRGMPSYSMARAENSMRILASCIDLQTRKIDVHSWTPDNQRQAGRNPGSRVCTWVTTLSLPICIPGRLLPTFCSTLAALRYSLRIRLNVKGMHHSTFKLEVPLQVLYCGDGPNIRVDSSIENHHHGNIFDPLGAARALQVSLSQINDPCFIPLMHYSILKWKSSPQLTTTTAECRQL